ncbi:MAG TPA: DUF3501 family protein [Acidimicrobiales bacterium]|nr:DUF3501 family protein [Acidimicrobiales bacterium]
MKLTLEDIADLRAYEREREEFRRTIIELKKARRVQVGPIISFVFENRDTVRFQIQEMARAERMLSDEAIQTELDIYNPLIPEAGELSATLFVELTDQHQMEDWLPRLVGIERSPVIGLPGGDRVRAAPEESHEAQLTRSDVTASVHYVRFRLEPAQVEAFASGPVTLGTDHPAYSHQVELTEATRRSLLADLRG